MYLLKLRSLYNDHTMIILWQSEINSSEIHSRYQWILLNFFFINQVVLLVIIWILNSLLVIYPNNRKVYVLRLSGEINIKILAKQIHQKHLYFIKKDSSFYKWYIYLKWVLLMDLRSHKYILSDRRISNLFFIKNPILSFCKLIIWFKLFNYDT